jgi:CheY-like chemotaxis protein
LSRVLIAEDYPEVSKMYQIALEHAGHSVVRAGDGLECLKLYREAMQEQRREESDGRPYGAVILDCRMPYMTCAEVANEILAMNKKQRILIAAAYVGPSELALLNNQNIKILLKPFEPKDLVKLVEGISH